MMKERPILFSSPMVRAILDGRKTQTRRVVSKANSLRDGSPWHKSLPFDAHDWPSAWVDGGPSPAGNVGPYLKVPFHEDDTVHRVYPKWSVGEQLWVKETHYPHDGHVTFATDCTTDGVRLMRGMWKPSIFMRRLYSRIQLEITGVRVERLNAISEADAKAEGIQRYGDGLWKCYNSDFGWEAVSDPVMSYRSLWDSINAKTGFGWEANPWVWVIEFRRLEVGRG